MKTTHNISSQVKTLVLIACTFLTFGQTVFGQKSNQKSEEIAKITRFQVKQEYVEQLKKLISDYVKLSLSTDANIMAEGYFEENVPSTLWLFERWNTKEAFTKANISTKAIKELSKTALVEPEKEIYVKDIEPISKNQWRKTSSLGDNQLTIMLFVDAKKGTESKFKKVYHQAMPQFRSELGVVTYQLSQLENDKSQFVTFEKFRSKEAFQYHLNFPPIQPVIDFLDTSIKKQPFQEGLHTLIEFTPLTRQ
ncbi:antibiotic biosynthesis monooxygenase [Arcicella sp. DC2W]|uniref:Antibiotic biosynthesis monooxygenase n=1 Tax=Arcicella gelida TaxID=2984195 RepID=A0ABU5S0K6_9BACT|nr:antibiotic biosynthesis monooxygenase [Arcicella sp. DC2W]MEA5402001.1 antibiotic biosynthesis monooxygenase [Arcicella sp. DC2W]